MEEYFSQHAGGYVREEELAVSMLVVRLGKRNGQSACWWLGKGRGAVSQHAGGKVREEERSVSMLVVREEELSVSMLVVRLGKRN